MKITKICSITLMAVTMMSLCPALVWADDIAATDPEEEEEVGECNHVDADKDGFCEICYSYSNTQPLDTVTADNYQALGLDEKYIGYLAIGNLAQLAYLAEKLYSPIVPSRMLQEIENESDAPRARMMRSAADDGDEGLIKEKIEGEIIEEIPDENESACKYVLTADITLNQDLFDAEGNVKEYDAEGVYRTNLLCWTSLHLEEDEIFDGNGHTISGLYHAFSFEKMSGFFCIVNEGAVVRNLGITHSYIRNSDWYSYGFGAIAGESEGLIENCWSDATIEITPDVRDVKVGGLVGSLASGQITDSYFTGTLKVSGEYPVGGIVGSTYSSRDDVALLRCHFSGNMECDLYGDYKLGGIAGCIDADHEYLTTVKQCYADGSVTVMGEDMVVSGIVGEVLVSDGTCQISHCLNLLSVTGKETYSVAGICNQWKGDELVDWSPSVRQAKPAMEDETALPAIPAFISVSSITNCVNYGRYPEAEAVAPVFFSGSNLGVRYCFTLADESRSVYNMIFYATEEEFASGLIAYILNMSSSMGSGIVQERPVELVVPQVYWYQEIGEDKCPVLSGDQYTIVRYDGEKYFNEVETAESRTLVDGEAYEQAHKCVVETLTYTRQVEESEVNQWQALYLPFQLSYSNWSKDFDIAAITNFRETFDNTGAIQNRELEVRLLTSGMTKANYPYLIRPKSAGLKTITLANETLYRAKSNAVTCASTECQYTFMGTYQPVADLATKGYSYMANGGLCTASSAEESLCAQRWYLTALRYDSQWEDEPEPVSLVGNIEVSVIGEQQTTIETLSTAEGRSEVYNLQGQRLLAPQKGINIQRGKKMQMK